MQQDILERLKSTDKEKESIDEEEKNQEENPLKKLDVLDRSDSSKKKFSEEQLKELVMSGDNTRGNFINESDKDEDGKPLHEEEDESLKTKYSGSVEFKGKYGKTIKSDFAKHPENYIIKTPKGEMTVRDALRQGYNPLTKRFAKEDTADVIREKHLKDLDDTEKEAISKIIDPKNARVPKGKASIYGLGEDSPMIDRGESGEELNFQDIKNTPEKNSEEEKNPEKDSEESKKAPTILDMLGGGK